MALAAWQATIVDEVGNVQAGASIEVRREATGALAAIYLDRDGETPLSNPFTADEDGFVRFYAAAGACKITATSGGFSRTWRHVAFGTLSEYDEVPSTLVRHERTSAEVSAGVTPVNYAYAPGDVRRYGAVGDGVTDDTEALKRWAAVVNEDDSIIVAELSGTYLIDFASLSASSYRLAEFSRDNLHIKGGGTIKAKTGTYTTGIANGEVRNHVAFYITGNRITVDGLTFDGNGQFSQEPYNAAGPNAWFTGVWLQGVSLSDRGKQNRVRGCRYINGGGWSFIGHFQEDAIISENYAEHSQGMGISGGLRCILTNNQSYNGHDAHFAAWAGSEYPVIANNIADTNDNGSGIDISGSQFFTITGNVLRNNFNRAIWVLQDPNTSAPTRYGVISGNVCYHNRNYAPIVEGGEIHIAGLDPISTSDPGRIDGHYIKIIGNFIEPNNGNAITVGPYADAIEIAHNVFRDGGDAVRGIVVHQGTNVYIHDNVDGIGNGKALGTGPVYLEEAGSRDFDFSAVDSDFTFFPRRIRTTNSVYSTPSASMLSSLRYHIEENYGCKRFTASYSAGVSNKNIFGIDILTEGSTELVIEIHAVCTGDRGAVGARYYYRGSNSTTPQALSTATTLYDVDGGSGSAPVITVTPASNGVITVAIAHDATLGGAMTATIYGPADNFVVSSKLT